QTEPVSNNSFATASPIGNTPSQLAFQADLNKLGDADFFKLVAPFNLLPTSLNIKIKTSGISLLVPSVLIYDASYHLLGSASASITSSRPVSTSWRPSTTTRSSPRPLRPG